MVISDGSLQSSEHIPHALNTDCKFFFFIVCSWVFTNCSSREGKYFLSNDTSFFHSSSITLQDLFKEENITTSSGCKRCVALDGNIRNQTFYSAAFTRLMLKWEARLSPNNMYFPGFCFTFSMKIKKKKKFQKWLTRLISGWSNHPDLVQS